MGILDFAYFLVLRWSLGLLCYLIIGHMENACVPTDKGWLRRTTVVKELEFLLQSPLGSELPAAGTNLCDSLHNEAMHGQV